jgi:hypothetical protein
VIVGVGVSVGGWVGDAVGGMIVERCVGTGGGSGAALEGMAGKTGVGAHPASIPVSIRQYRRSTWRLKRTRYSPLLIAGKWVSI